MTLRNLHDCGKGEKRWYSDEVSWTFDPDESNKINYIFALSKTF